MPITSLSLSGVRQLQISSSSKTATVVSSGVGDVSVSDVIAYEVPVGISGWNSHVWHIGEKVGSLLYVQDLNFPKPVRSRYGEVQATRLVIICF